MRKYNLIMRRPNVVSQNVDLPVAKLTSEIMDFYIASDFELLTPDAIHLATALHLNTHEFHTFDGSDASKKPRRSKYQRCGLLKLDGNVAGHKLSVVRPSAQQFGLFQGPAPVQGDFVLTSPELLTEQGTLALNVAPPETTQTAEQGRSRCHLQLTTGSAAFEPNAEQSSQAAPSLESHPIGLAK